MIGGYSCANCSFVRRDIVEGNSSSGGGFMPFWLFSELMEIGTGVYFEYQDIEYNDITPRSDLNEGIMDHDRLGLFLQGGYMSNS